VRACVRARATTIILARPHKRRVDLYIHVVFSTINCIRCSASAASSSYSSSSAALRAQTTRTHACTHAGTQTRTRSRTPLRYSIQSPPPPPPPPRRYETPSEWSSKWFSAVFSQTGDLAQRAAGWRSNKARFVCAARVPLICRTRTVRQLDSIPGVLLLLLLARATGISRRVTAGQRGKLVF
jgi:hypothetical protein